MKKIIALVLLIAVLVVGCQLPAMKKTQDTSEPTTIVVEEGSDEASVESIEDDLAEIEDLDLDKELADLDSLDEDLADI